MFRFGVLRFRLVLHFGVVYFVVFAVLIAVLVAGRVAELLEALWDVLSPLTGAPLRTPRRQQRLHRLPGQRGGVLLLQMPHEVPAEREGACAVWTPVRLARLVDGHVGAEVVRTCQSLAAHRAGIGLHLCVGHQVHLERLRLREALSTTIAAEAPLRLVDEHVALHVGLEGEGPAADWAREWLHGAVGDQVVAEVVLLHEAHAAVVAGEAADLRVHQHVVAQLARVLEQPLTHFALKLVRRGLVDARRRTGRGGPGERRRVVLGDVGRQVAGKREPAAAQSAGQAAAAVSHHVALQVGHLQEAVLAVRTAVRPPALVDEEVGVQVGLLLERLVAHLALEPLQTRVAQQVGLQVVLLGELLAADVALPSPPVAEELHRATVPLELAVRVVTVAGRPAGVAAVVGVSREVSRDPAAGDADDDAWRGRRVEHLQLGFSVRLRVDHDSFASRLTLDVVVFAPADELLPMARGAVVSAAGDDDDGTPDDDGRAHRDAVFTGRFRRAQHRPIPCLHRKAGSNRTCTGT
uniref:Putative secreted protein n=1 Tax=Ixodes ricinus TaxID=34613 RepID=A0A147BCY1_IXORI